MLNILTDDNDTMIFLLYKQTAENNIYYYYLRFPREFTVHFIERQRSANTVFFDDQNKTEHVDFSSIFCKVCIHKRRC